MAKSALWKKGDAVRTRLMGQATVRNMNKGVYDDPIMEKFGDYAREAVFGMLWSRPGLDLKTRSLITVAMLTAQGKQQELKAHVRGALNNGATPEEIRELMLHATVYCGFPTAIDAFRSATEVIEPKT